MNKNEILAELATIDGEMISLEAMSKGLDVSESGAIIDGFKPGEIEESPFNMFERLRIGDEAMINSSVWGRIFGRLNVLFSMNHDSRMSKRAADLNFINTATIDNNTSVAKFDSSAVNLFLNAFNYQRVDRSKLSELEGFRLRLKSALETPGSYLVKSLKWWFGGRVVVLMLIFVSIPLAILMAVATDFFVYYYLLMAIFTAIGVTGDVDQSMTSSEIVPFICKLIGAVYENGSGKKVKYEEDGSLSIGELNRISVDIEDAMNRMNNAFIRCSRGVPVDYEDKVKIAKQLKDATADINQKYHDPNISKQGIALYNLVAVKVAKREEKAMRYSPYSQKIAIICDVMNMLIENSKNCDKHLTTIVRGLYKM